MTASTRASQGPALLQGPLSTSPLLLMAPHVDLDLDLSAYLAILDLIEDGVYFVDRSKNIRFWNRGAETITGFSRAEMLGLPCGNQAICHVDAGGRLLCTSGCPIQAALDRGVPLEMDAYLRHKLGHRVPIRVKTSALRDRHKRLVGAIEVFRSAIADRRQDQLIEELSHLALIDDLTHLPNRRHFDMQLDRRLAELNRFGWPFGILMLDLDTFKQVNDNFGHQTGDRALGMVARTLSANCRSLDTLCRWGGDEFSAIITNVREDDLRTVAEKFRAMVEASGLHQADQDPLCITVSIGGAIANPNETAAELVSRADEMLYSAKRSGRNRVCL